LINQWQTFCQQGGEAMQLYDIDRNWDAIFNILPNNWKELSLETKALSVGSYVFNDPYVLMKAMLCYLIAGASFETVAARLMSQGIVKSVSSIGVLKKFRNCANYFKELSAIMIQERIRRELPNRTYPWVIRAFDGTHIVTPGDKVKDLRLHMSIDVLSGAMDYVEVTDIHGGESLKRFKTQEGELILADSGYGHRGGVASIMESGAHIIVRTNSRGMPLNNMDGSEFNFTNEFSNMTEHEMRSCQVCFEDNGVVFNGRICAYKKDLNGTERSIKIAIKNAKRKGNKYPSESAIFAAGYVFVFTSLDEGEMVTEDVLRFYRMRWQIEIYFKKLKSQFDVGRPPSESPASLDAWIHGKILATLLVEGFADSAKPFPPSAQHFESAR
jgi:hypothetical protein